MLIERAKVLMLVYSPQKDMSSYMPASANLIDIENSFKDGEGDNEEDGQPEEAEQSGDSDESMSRLLHGAGGRRK